MQRSSGSSSSSLDNQNLTSLIATYKQDEQCHNEVLKVFNRTYSNLRFYVGPFDLVWSNSSAISESKGKSVSIQQLQAADDVFRIFGKFIQFIEISYANITEIDGQKVTSFINELSNSSLIQLHLLYCHGNVLKTLINQTFPIVVSASYSDHPIKKHTGEHPHFDDLFPNLTRLIVQLTND